MSIKEQLPNILEFFDLDDEAKQANFQQALQESFIFSEKLKNMIFNGTEEQRDEIYTLLDEIKQRAETQLEHICSKLNVSQEELQALVFNPENFSQEEWAAIQEVRQYVDTQAKSTQEKKPKKRKKLKRSDWVQS